MKNGKATFWGHYAVHGLCNDGVTWAQFYSASTRAEADELARKLASEGVDMHGRECNRDAAVYYGDKHRMVKCGRRSAGNLVCAYKAVR